MLAPQATNSKILAPDGEVIRLVHWETKSFHASPRRFAGAHTSQPWPTNNAGQTKNDVSIMLPTNRYHTQTPHAQDKTTHDPPQTTARENGHIFRNQQLPRPPAAVRIRLYRCTKAACTLYKYTTPTYYDRFVPNNNLFHVILCHIFSCLPYTHICPTSPGLPCLPERSEAASRANQSSG